MGVGLRVGVKGRVKGWGLRGKVRVKVMVKGEGGGEGEDEDPG